MKSDAKKDRESNIVGCPSDYQLDAFWLEGHPNQHPLRSHLDACERCRVRMAERERIAVEFSKEVYPQSVEPVVNRVTQRPGILTVFVETFQSISWWKGFAVATAMGLILILGLILWRPGEPTGIDHNYIGIKGELGLEIWCRRGQQVFRVFEGETLFPQDQLRFVPVAPVPGYLMIISVDSHGRLSLYYPTEGQQALQIENGSVALPGSIILDESSGPERIFALFSERNFEIEAVRRSVETGLQQLPQVEKLVNLPLQVLQASILIHKGKKLP